jgi:hypothetical protein
MTSTEQRRRARDQRVPGATAPNWLLVLVASVVTGAAIYLPGLF